MTEVKSPNKQSDNFLNILSVESLSGVGPKMAEKLKKLSIYHVTDLLFHLPFRYQDKTRITPIADLLNKTEAQIEGVVQNAKMMMGKRPMMTCEVSDASGTIRCRFFHFSKSQLQGLKEAKRIRCFGEVRKVNNRLEMAHPEYRILQADEERSLDTTLTPIYATTDGVGQNSLRKLIQQGLHLLTRYPLTEYIPEPPSNVDVVKMDVCEAIVYCHTPPPDADTELLLEGLHPAQQKLCFEEFVAHQLCLKKLQSEETTLPAPKLTPGKLFHNFEQTLPFTLTNAQQRVMEEIKTDLALDKPMKRLLQGDVGAGKTIIAALSALIAVEHGLQAIIMAPTEILAEQHLQSFEALFKDFSLELAFLSGSLTQSDKNKALERIHSGKAQIIIGTHALIQDSVQFDKLGIIIIDEQHRFGVHQRLALQNKQKANQSVHQLVMTATPIPRTLAMTAYTALDCSIIDELPPGRSPVNTIVLPNSKREEVITRIKAAISEGRQVYWVCTLINESEVLESQAAELSFQQLQESIPEANIALIHGKCSATEKEQVMDGFSKGEISCLVATTVIEVGVNVPNASVMVIENPERLGLAQLHQLRGRVGRGTTQSFCVLLYQSPLSDTAVERLKVMRESNDGFFIAEKDLQIRGPGEFLGTRQSGLPQYQIANIIRDQALIQPARKLAKKLLDSRHKHVEALISRWLMHKQVCFKS